MFRIQILFLIVSFFFVIPLNAENREFTIGLLVELSGPNVANGKDCQAGFEVAREWLAPNDKVGNIPVRFVYGDTQRDPKVGIAEFQKMLDTDRVDAVTVLGSPVGMAVNPISKQRKVPLLGVTGHADFIKNNDYAYRFWPSTTAEGRAIAESMLEAGKRTVVSIVTQEEWLLSLNKEFKSAFEKRGGKVLADLELLSSETEFSTIITRLRQLQPDAVFVDVSYAQLGVLLKRLHEQRLQSSLWSNAWAEKKEVMETAGKEAMQGLRLELTKVVDPEFADMLIETAPEAHLGSFSFCCYTALAAMLKTLGKFDSAPTSAQFDLALRGTSKLELLDRTLSVDKREVAYELAIKEFKGVNAVWSR